MVGELKPHPTRRAFRRDTALLSAGAAGGCSGRFHAAAARRIELGDGKTHAGWRAATRLVLPPNPEAAQLSRPTFDAELIARRTGATGRIALEVHDVNPASPLGMDRWAKRAICRWRNITILEL
jgi:hypothetical protein